MPEEIRTPEPVAEMSMSDTIVGILSSPSEVYAAIATTEPKRSNWLIPLLLVIAAGIVFTLSVFTQPAIQDQMMEAQTKAMQKSVAEGRMTQEQMEQALEMNPAKPGSTMFLLFGSIGMVGAMVFTLFVYSGVYFLAGKLILKSSVPYGKVLEVNGLSYYVGTIATLLTVVTVVAMGSIYAAPSAALFVENFDPMDKTHKFLSALNILEFWQLFVIAVGLAKIWQTTLAKGLAVVGGVWLVWTLVKVFANFGFGM
ncbi:MAG: YIP1 family protein [Bacteroidetes bacterium]|nr:YIP1 family protein [Bacteroidota bacterium]